MKGQEIINNIVRAEMPDREQIRINCHAHAKCKPAANRPIRAIKAVSVSACAVFAFAAVLILKQNGMFDMPAIIDGNSNLVQTDEIPDNIINPEPDYGVDIPAIKLPSETDGVKYNMIGLFVYQGQIYTQSAWYYNEEAKHIKENLMGEKIGYATGNINEWSTQDEYAVNFAGSARGDVYTVKGYDESFRLCIAGSYTEPVLSDNGAVTVTEWVCIYENLNGIGLTVGEDLFGGSFGRLQLLDNWLSVKTQEHDNWNNYGPLEYVYQDLEGISKDDITAFISQLYSSRFEYVYEANPDFYNSQNQAHLYFYMKDGTVVELRLFEGGYAGYQHLGWYFVKMPGDVFDKIFNACR